LSIWWICLACVVTIYPNESIKLPVRHSFLPPDCQLPRTNCPPLILIAKLVRDVLAGQLLELAAGKIGDFLVGATQLGGVLAKFLFEGVEAWFLVSLVGW